VFKPLLTIAAAGFAGFALWKVLSFLFLPLLGTLLGIVLTLLKVALVAGLVWFVVQWFMKTKRKDDEAPAS
jgi:threonine/homoserine/homoserine lactone efflux protein